MYFTVIRPCSWNLDEKDQFGIFENNAINFLKLSIQFQLNKNKLKLLALLQDKYNTQSRKF